MTCLWEGELDQGRLAAATSACGFAYVDGRFAPAEHGDLFAVALNATGLFGYIRKCTALEPGQRLAPLNGALMEFVDERYGTGFGELVPAPDLRS